MHEPPDLLQEVSFKSIFLSILAKQRSSIIITHLDSIKNKEQDHTIILSIVHSTMRDDDSLPKQHNDNYNKERPMTTNISINNSQDYKMVIHHTYLVDVSN